MKKFIQVFRKKQPCEPLVYSRVVADSDKTKMAELLKIAVKKANEDQRAVVSSI